MRCHIIKANEGSSRPSRVVFFDVETSQRPLANGDIAQDFRYGEALYWRRGEAEREETLESFSITSPSDFWDWVISKGRKKSLIYLTSHNLNIDLVALDAFQELPERGFKLHSFYVRGMTKIIVFKSPGMTLKCLDNANWWKSPLAELGELVGYPKLKVNPVGASLEELIPYCKRDVEIIYRIWVQWFRFLDDHDLGNWGITIGSQAFKSFTHRFMNTDIFVHNNPQAIELERKAYHGGRVEPFWIGTWTGEDRHKVDVNSMYPFVMADHLYPVKLLTVNSQMTVEGLSRVLVSKLAVADVEIKVDEPVFPYASPAGAIYPIGQFRTVLCTPELRYALDRGWVLKVYQVAIYAGADIFSKYVRYFYDLKAKYTESGNPVYRNAVKLMLNCLYGKFGQKGLEAKVVGECDPDLVKVEPYIHAQTEETGYLLYLAGTVIQVIEKPVSYNSCVAIAAHCTAYARMYLWRLINEAGRGNCFYVDTDSLLLNSAGLNNTHHLLDFSRLGMLKLEGTFSNGAIYGKKDYRLGDHIILKGIPKRSEKIGELTYGFDMWPSLRLLLRDGNLSQYYIRPTTRTLKRCLTWGDLGEKGAILPFHILPMPEISDADYERMYHLEMEIAVLKDSKRFPQSLIFTLWDYRQGAFRHGVEDLMTAPHYKGLYPDTVSQEYGFYEYSDFLAAVEAQVKLDARIRKVRSALYELRSGSLPVPDPELSPQPAEPIPF